jgi:ATP-dependent 26S proteasome regulatory subunit
VERVFRTADMVIEVPAPTRSHRRELFTDEIDHLAAESLDSVDTEHIDVDDAAIKTEGFSVEEVRNVVHRTVEQVERGTHESLTGELLRETAEQLNSERHEELSSSLVADMFEAPKTNWDDIGGLENAKREIQKSINQPHGWNILLYGPPGTGKTMLARAAANDTDRSFIPVKAADVGNGVDELFDLARRNSPSVVFFDEFDSIAGRRGAMNHTSDDVVNSLLSEIDGLGEEDADVMVIAATNREGVLDPAICRPGRLHKHIEVAEPDAADIADIVQIHMADMQTSEQVTAEWVSNTVEVTTGAEIAAICERAETNALTDASGGNDAQSVSVAKRHFLAAEEQFWSDRVGPSLVDDEESSDEAYH